MARACFYDGMHDQLFFIVGSDGSRWNVRRIGGIRFRHYDNGIAEGSEVHMKLDHAAEAGSTKYFFSDPYQPRDVKGIARWQLAIDWETNRFTLKSVSVNTGKNLFDESGHCIDVQAQ